VSIVLGEPSTEYGTGLQHIYFENDGLTTVTVLDDVACRHLKLDSGEFGYFYFTLDPTFKKVPLRHARIEVEYYDLKPGTLTLHFDASETKTNSNPRYTEATPKVALHGTATWQIATFYVENATSRTPKIPAPTFACVSVRRNFMCGE